MLSPEQIKVEHGGIWTRRAWWLVLTSCLAALLVYGVFRLTESPRIETITTHAPEANSNDVHASDVEFRQSKRLSRR